MILINLALFIYVYTLNFLLTGIICFKASKRLPPFADTPLYAERADGTKHNERTFFKLINTIIDETRGKSKSVYINKDNNLISFR